jgi:hypothetical protein
MGLQRGHCANHHREHDLKRMHRALPGHHQAQHLQELSNEQAGPRLFQVATTLPPLLHLAGLNAHIFPLQEESDSHTQNHNHRYQGKPGQKEVEDRLLLSIGREERSLVEGGVAI